MSNRNKIKFMLQALVSVLGEPQYKKIDLQSLKDKINFFITERTKIKDINTMSADYRLVSLMLNKINKATDTKSALLCLSETMFKVS